MTGNPKRVMQRSVLGTTHADLRLAVETASGGVFVFVVNYIRRGMEVLVGQVQHSLRCVNKTRQIRAGEPEKWAPANRGKPTLAGQDEGSKNPEKPECVKRRPAGHFVKCDFVN